VPDEPEFPDLSDITPPISPVAEPRGSIVRPGYHVTPPSATDPDWHQIEHDVMVADMLLAQCRYLFRVSRKPHNDAAWPSLCGQLLDVRARIRRHNDPGLFERRLAEINRFLGPAYR